MMSIEETAPDNMVTPLEKIPTGSSVPDIALFIPTACGGGGAERVMIYLANGFSQLGLAVDLLVVSTEGPFLKEVCKTVRIIDLSPTQGRYYLRLILRLILYLRQVRPRHMLSAMNIYNFVAIFARALAFSSTRLCISEHVSISDIMRIDRPFLQHIMPFAIRHLYPRADGIVTVSAGVADNLAQFAKLDRNRISVVYNPVPATRIAAEAEQPLEHPWFAPDQPPVLLGVGRLHVQKDFPNLLRAFAIIRTQRPIRLVILGEGELRSELETLAKKLDVSEDVAFPGFVDNPYTWMLRAAVFVLSSTYEGLANVLIEAMATGTSVVSTDCPSGPAEVLEGGKWGRLVLVEDPGALAQAIIKTLDTPETIDVTKRAQDFSVEKSVRGYMAAMKF